MRAPAMILLLAVLAAMAGGCASGPGRGKEPLSQLPPPAQTGSPACFVRRLVASFTVLDETNLVVYAPSRDDAYHVRISPPAPEMASAGALAFTSRGHQVCGAAEDAVFFQPDPAAPRHAIIGVSRLSEGALEQLLVLAASSESDPG